MTVNAVNISEETSHPVVIVKEVITTGSQQIIFEPVTYINLMELEPRDN